jgi:streptomycin 6-kinase
MSQPAEPTLPSNLVTAAGREGRQAWLATLPETIRYLGDSWSLRLGKAFQPGGNTAWVAPVVRGKDDLVLKVLWRHPEAEHEADALQLWAGNGAVRLHCSEMVDSHTIALLIERCRPGRSLRAAPEIEQDSVLAGLLHRLWIEPPAGHRFRSLKSMCDMWADDLEEEIATEESCLNPGFARDGVALLRGLPASAEREVLLCTDLHADNVLAAEREPWLVIDPKPYVGDPTYDAVQHLLNCEERLHDDPRRLALRMADLLEVDPDRLLSWLFARCALDPTLLDVAQQLAPS